MGLLDPAAPVYSEGGAEVTAGGGLTGVELAGGGGGGAGIEAAGGGGGGAGADAAGGGGGGVQRM